jgi:hypothetical protein
MLLAVDALEDALAQECRPAEERAWSERVLVILARLADNLERDRAGLKASKEAIEEANPSQKAVPALDRRIQALRGDDRNFLAEVRSLQGLIESVIEADHRAGPRTKTSGTHAHEPTDPAVPLIRERGEELINALRMHHRDKANVILEHVTTELGAGD